MSLHDSADRVIADLRELAELTSNAEGAQRLAWGPVWRTAREWFTNKLAELDLTFEKDSAGNGWATLPGKSEETVIIGSHLDSVYDGGWLDGCLGVLVGLEALRRAKAQGDLPVTLKVVDWADEEGARFGRSLLGSSAAGGTLNIEDVRDLKDKDGIRWEDALRENGVELNGIMKAHDELKKIPARAYLELHIEQGPVLEAAGQSTGVVIGTFGVERHRMVFKGQAAHSGSTPIPHRKDSFLAAAATALEVREIGLRHCTPEVNAVCTIGMVEVHPCIVTAVPGMTTISIDQRSLFADTLASMYKQAQEASEKHARENNCTVEWHKLWQIEPRPFDEELMNLAAEAVQEITGEAPRLPSGPLHDAAEMVPHMPTVMMFAYSSNGLSHCKEEDTPIPHLQKTLQAFLLLVEKTVNQVAGARV
jgi:N-carbamoyl-L-amino-acid hydrolase